ncbi:MAG: hypothetical protein ABSE63_07310 [Thermoguttaceae bacterium]
MTAHNPVNTLRNRRLHTFRRGEWAEVRAPEDILATLDAEGKLDGLPFMPEMVKYCGRKFRVTRRADRIFLDRYCYVARLKDTVFLEILRCDGQAHDGCQMRCKLFWKEAWLKPSDPPNERETNLPDKELVSLNLPTRKGDRFTCQATELVHASNKLPWWDPRQYVREVMLGETTVGELFVDLLGRTRHKILRLFKRQDASAENPLTQPTPIETLNLQAGQWVEVKSLPEIQATLDANGKNRGLSFAPDQAEFCGKRFRVAGRVERLILEWSGELRTIANTVELEEVTCQGRMCRACPRNCHHLWREIWLRRVPGS